MPSHTPSNAFGRPRRSKSVPSVRHPQLKHARSFNSSELAHQEALTAAELAFERATARYAAANGLEYSTVTNAAHPTLGSYTPQLGKNQSVRFTGSNAVKVRELPNTRRELSKHQEASNLKDRAPQPEYVETIAASEPSSYRRLRKTKSMFSSSKPPSNLFTDSAHPSKGHFKRESMRSSDYQNDLPRLPDRRLRRSFSFLRGVTDRLSTSNQQYVTNDAAICAARDQYLRQLEEQRLEEQPSFLDLARKRKTQKGFRRTVRASSISSHGTDVQPPLLSIDEVKGKSISHKARSVSQTLKKTLKRVFGRSSPNVPKLPVQHLSAAKAHYGDRSDNYSEHHYPPIPSPDIGLLRRVDSRESILRDVTGFNESKAHTGSLRSLTTLDESNNHQSRVTSWTNSTAANTVEMPQFVERKRLSIIKEDGGPHQPSSSAGRCMDPRDRYAIFRQPVRLDSPGPAAAQRVYSALQREIHKGEQNAALDDSETRTDSSSDRSSPEAPNGTLRKSSSSHIRNDGLPTTILRTYGIPLSKSGSITSNPTTSMDESFLQPGQGRRGLPNHENRYIEPVERLSPQQVAQLNEPELPSPKKPLREVKSAFFPSEPRIERRTTSPYRRAIYDSSEDPTNAEGHNACTRPNAWLASPRIIASAHNDGSTTSGSVYSRTEGGHSPRAIDSSLSLLKTDSSGEPGTAVIISSRLQSPGHPGSPSSPTRQVSYQSSGEWKTWMASEVSLFENHVPKNDGIYNALPNKESGHKREKAQWDGEDVVIGKLMKPIHPTNQPLGTLQTKANARPALQEMMSRSNVERAPLHDVKTSEKEKIPLQKENTPDPFSQRPSNKHVTAEDENTGSISPTTAFTGPHAKASQFTLSSRSENNSSATSANSRNSPERAKRLRKLQSKSSQSLNKINTSPRTDPVVYEIQATQAPPNGSPFTLNRVAQSFSSPFNQMASKQALVGTSPKNRRSQMRTSDESGGDHAFL